MNPLPLTDIAGRCGARIHNAHGVDPMVSRVVQDTRKLRPGDLYLALRGERFDGHDFVSAASECGAVGAIVAEDAKFDAPPDFPLLVVCDPLQALHRLAESWRAELACTVVCLTGSSGKTSTKEFLASVLSQGGQVSATQGNLNNHIGLPLSILETSREHQFAVWEIGMNHPGEIAPLAAIARPRLSVITNIGTAHIEFFESRAAIASEKGALFTETDPDGLCFYPASDDYAETLQSIAGRRASPVGEATGSPRAKNLRPTADGVSFTLEIGDKNADVHLPVPGQHMVSNALLAAAVGKSAGLSLEQIVAGLEDVRMVGGRLRKMEICGLAVLDDTYNANPESVLAALRTLAVYPVSENAKRIAVLGRMGELGHYEKTGYERVGQGAAETVDCLVTVGPETEFLAQSARSAGLGRVYTVPDHAAATVLLRSITRPGDVLLVKGSRAATMETIINQLAA
jgi:UDP-N-acetylmuramoyl-tripeptide--D-alanyl-D-alanine ligase